MRHRLVIVEADRHDQRGYVEAQRRWKIARHRDTDAKQQQGHIGECLLAHYQQQVNCQKAEETGDLPDRLLNTNLAAREVELLNRKVVHQVPPGSKGQLHGASHDHQKDHRGPPPGYFVGAGVLCEIGHSVSRRKRVTSVQRC